jgi:hypothetical protein
MADMPERGTPNFYRQQAARLTALAAQVGDRALRQQFEHIAKSNQLLADFFAANQTQPAPSRAAR